jgi:putative acyl-CoA dehydrogenase
MCLDVLRALAREAEVAAAVLEDFVADTRGLPGAAEAVAFLARTFRRPDGERVARQAVETLAQLAAAAALNRTAPDQAALFSATRLGGTHGRMYGTAELSVDDGRRLLERTLP